ncbi:alpha/beta hydrolase [Lysinibacillus sp. NPDC094403]|uniref:alpha/beta hydrolase n=1 Tax=Lysinibacillus sp. NPDC094403 TaxID=3390581 RepID=UPI003D023601
MKKILLFLVPAFLLLYLLFNQGDPNTKKDILYSQALKKDMKVNIYLPTGYSTDNKYPVLFLFHGKDGNEDSFMNGFYGFNGIKIDRVADELIQKGEIKPLVIVSPEIDNSYGINSSSTTISRDGYNLGMYEDYILKELVPYIQDHYSVATTRDGSFIGGISMGGFVALNLGLSHPDVFSKIGGHSAAIWENQNDIPTGLSWLAKSDMNLFELVKKQDLSGIQLYLDHGDMDHDWLIQGNTYLNDLLDSHGVKTQLHVRNGGHNYSFWKSQVKNYLLFYMQNN